MLKLQLNLIVDLTLLQLLLMVIDFFSLDVSIIGLKLTHVKTAAIKI